MIFKKIIINVILSFFVMLFILIVFEVCLRTFVPQNLRHDIKGAYIPFGDLRCLKSNIEIQYVNPESKTTWKINSHGLRDSEKPYVKPKGTYRIIGLGDSFMFGFGVEQEETFLHLLEEFLNSSKKLNNNIDNFETLNMGIGGYGTVAELNMLLKKGVKYQPDLIILSVFVGNDVYDSLKEYNIINNKKTIYNIQKAKERNSFNYKVRKYFGSHFHIYSFISIKFHKLLVKTGIRKIAENNIDILKYSEDRKTQQGWAILKNYILKIAETAKRKSAQFMVVLIPIRHQVHKHEWEFICKAYNLNPNDYDIDKPQKILRKFCKDNKFYCLDLIKSFRNKNKPIYFLREETHFNKYGHNVAAEEISKFIKKNNILLQNDKP